MLSKPVIEILTGSLVSGNNSAQLEVSRSAGSRTPSPRGIKKSYDFGGVGLGIVAALEKSDGITAGSALFSRNLSRSKPIPTRNAKMCSDGGEGGRKGDDRPPFRIPNSNRGSVFHISPPRFAGEGSGFPAPDFLSSCHLCQKKLHGKDIYMYRGEKAFCSAECRYRQMVVDERKEKCSSEVSKPAAEVAAGSPYPNGQIFATAGILAI